MSNRHPLKDDISYNTPHRSKPKRKHKEKDNNHIIVQPDFPGGRSNDLSVADYILSDNDNNEHEEYDSFYDENNNSKSGYKHRSAQRYTTNRSHFGKNDSELYYDNFEIYDVDNKSGKK